MLPLTVTLPLIGRRHQAKSTVAGQPAWVKDAKNQQEKITLALYDPNFAPSTVYNPNTAINLNLHNSNLYVVNPG